MLEAGIMGKREDLSDFDEGQNVTALTGAGYLQIKAATKLNWFMNV